MDMRGQEVDGRPVVWRRVNPEEKTKKIASGQAGDSGLGRERRFRTADPLRVKQVLYP